MWAYSPQVQLGFEQDSEGKVYTVKKSLHDTKRAFTLETFFYRVSFFFTSVIYSNWVKPLTIKPDRVKLMLEKT